MTADRWRETANTRPGYATWPNTQPGSLCRADLETRCTLTTGTCNCTRRAGCLQTNEDAFDDPDSD